jgi:hypothetical protein
MKFVILDIDGVLNNYPHCWLQYIELHNNQKFNTIEEAKKKLGEAEYKKIKHLYRTSGYKRDIPVNPEAPAFIKKLKQKGYKIIIATSRPFHLYPDLKNLTREWLQKNDILFDALEIKSEQLLTTYPGVEFHVDDELAHSHFFLEKNINVYLIKRHDIDYKDHEQHQSLKFVNTLNDILMHIP